MNSYYQTYTALASAAAFFFEKSLKKSRAGRRAVVGQQRIASRGGSATLVMKARKHR